MIVRVWINLEYMVWLEKHPNNPMLRLSTLTDIVWSLNDNLAVFKNSPDKETSDDRNHYKLTE